MNSSNCLKNIACPTSENKAQINILDTTKGKVTEVIPFDDFEIHGVREFGHGNHRHCEQVPDTDAQYWSLFGHIPGQGLECIGDFRSRSEAEEVLASILAEDRFRNPLDNLADKPRKCK